MENMFKDLQRKLSDQNIYEYEILDFSRDGTLTIVGSFDFGYYHNAEIYFKGVTYISCPTTFNYATFRLATEEECLSIKSKLFDGQGDYVICISLDEDNPKHCVKHFVVAKEVQYKFEMVYYYKRDNLKEGERMADWIK